MAPVQTRFVAKRSLNRPTLSLMGATSLALLVAGCSTRSRTTEPPLLVSDMTYVEAREMMVADGSINDYVTTRKRLGRQTTPKHPGKAWDWFVRVRLPLEDDDRALPPFYRQESWQETRLRNMDKSTLLRANAQWRYIGPGGFERDGTPVQPSGRIVEIAVDPNNNNIVYAGAASGGLFKTTDQGRNWANVTDADLPSLGLGAVQISPFNSNVLLLGMGEGVPGSHYEPTGAGVYRSTDAGASWSLIPGTQAFEHVVDLDFLGDGNSIVVAAKGRRDSRGAGLFITTNGGQTWTTASQEPFFDISVNPANRQDFVATRAFYRTEQGIQLPVISRTTNGGQSFTTAQTPAMINGAQTVAADRLELARRGDTLYALVGGTDRGIFGIWRSTDGGSTWTARPMAGIPADGDYKPGQMNYNNSIQVDPSNENIVYIGTNLRPYKSTDGAGSFTAFADWAGEGGLPYMHADHHHIWVSNNGQTVYYATDGGFFVSTNSGVSWEERNNGFTATQLYRIGAHPTNRNAVIMGAQDNDKYLRRADGTWHHYPNTWGDGMEMIAWPGNPDVFMGTNYFGVNTRVTLDAGGEWFFLRTYGQSNNGIPDEERGAWVSPFMLDPLDQNKLYFLLQNLYVADFTTSNLPLWRQVIPFNGTPETMELLRITSGPQNRKFVGFLARQTEQSFTVTLMRANLDGTQVEFPDMPRLAWVSGLATDPNNNNTIWIGYSDLFTDQNPKPRIFKSTNLGDTWTDMTNNFPSNLPVNAIWVDPANSNTVIVGSDIGVYRSDNGGQTWVFWNEGLPKVVVNDFEYFAPQRLLRAGTYGRGMWETPLEPVAGAPDIRIEPTILLFP